MVILAGSFIFCQIACLILANLSTAVTTRLMSQVMAPSAFFYDPQMYDKRIKINTFAFRLPKQLRGRDYLNFRKFCAGPTGRLRHVLIAVMTI